MKNLFSLFAFLAVSFMFAQTLPESGDVDIGDKIEIGKDLNESQPVYTIDNGVEHVGLFFTIDNEVGDDSFYFTVETPANDLGFYVTTTPYIVTTELTIKDDELINSFKKLVYEPPLIQTKRNLKITKDVLVSSSGGLSDRR